MIVRTVLAVGLAAVFVPSAASLGTASYSGTIRLRGAEPSNVTLQPSRGKVTVTLGPGHVAHAEVQLKHKDNTLRFSAPGLPKQVVTGVLAVHEQAEDGNLGRRYRRGGRTRLSSERHSSFRTIERRRQPRKRTTNQPFTLSHWTCVGPSCTYV